MKKKTLFSPWSALALAFLLAAGCSFPTATGSPKPTTTAVSRPTSFPSLEATINIPPTDTLESCLASGDQETINAMLHGPGSMVWLCQGAVFALTAPVVINADRQQISTIGLPTGDRRAVLRLASGNITSAVVMRDHSNAVLSNVIVDGNRPQLGKRDGDALIYAGGYASGQIIQAVKVMNTRSWSSIHLIEGDTGPGGECRNALVADNDVSSAGTSAEWADGISLACINSIVRNNRIIDATDGGIVIFGAPGSLIEDNLIRAETRTLLGGINMVDYAPYDGNYSGTIVRNNTVDAAAAVIRIGLAMGPRTWGCLPSVSGQDTVHGGTVTGNTLMGSKMQYGFAIDGVTDWTVTGNIDRANHSGSPSQDCASQVASRPAGFQYNPQRAKGTFQPEFQPALLDLALWAILSPRPGE